MNKFYTMILSMLVSAFTLGCGGSTGGVGPGMDPHEADLVELGELLRLQQKPPTKVTDLSKQESLYPKGYTAVKSGAVVVLWGTPMMAEGEMASGAPGVLVAHEKDVESKGGYVLMSNGKVKKVESSEFGSLPKGKK